MNGIGIRHDPAKPELSRTGQTQSFLHITGRRADGYHTLQTLFRFIAVYDTLNFALRTDGQIHRLANVAGVAENADLCVRAARLLQQETGCTLGVDIGIEKHIPMGGGLGGGSSDAATTLIALNRLWSLALNRTRLMQLGLKLGRMFRYLCLGKALLQRVWARSCRPSACPRHGMWCYTRRYRYRPRRFSHIRN